MTDALRLTGITKNFGQTEIIRGVDLTVETGERHAIIGPNGAPLPPGREGEIRVRGAMRFLGYLDAELDADAIDPEGYVRTGDLGVLAPDRLGHVVDQLVGMVGVDDDDRR